MSAPARFTVTGGGEPEHGAPSLGAGISVAQDFARRHRYDAGEVSFYVRDGDAVGFAIVTKTAVGSIETELTLSGRLDLGHAATGEATHVVGELEAGSLEEYERLNETHTASTLF